MMVTDLFRRVVRTPQVSKSDTRPRVPSGPSFQKAPAAKSSKARTLIGINCAATSGTTTLPPLPTSGDLAPPADIQRAVESQPWRGGLEPCGDIPKYTVDAACISGELPKDLNSVVYRLGPGRIRVGASKYEHWFDGDGQMTEVTLSGADQTVELCSRLVQTDRVRKQQAATGRGIKPRGAWTQSEYFLGNLLTFPTNPANTAPVVWGGRLLALCEGGLPVEMQPGSLATRGPVDLGLGQAGAQAFGAHFKVDQEEGIMYNMGMLKPPAAGYKVVALDSEGTIVRAADLTIPPGTLSFVHDFAMSERYLVFFLCPWKSSGGAMVKALLGLESLGHSFEWDAEAGTRCVVMRKADLSIEADFQVQPAFSTYHIGNAWDETDAEGKTRIRVLTTAHLGPRQPIEDNFRDMYNAQWERQHYTELKEMVIDVAAGRAEAFEAAAPAALPLEFPLVAPAVAGRRARYVYTTAFSDRPGCNYFDALQKTDLDSGENQTRYFPEHVYPGEPVFVERKGEAEDSGYLVFFTYDAKRHGSDIVILDAADFTGDPVCTIKLAHHIPYTFHGYTQDL